MCNYRRVGEHLRVINTHILHETVEVCATGGGDVHAGRIKSLSSRSETDYIWRVD